MCIQEVITIISFSHSDTESQIGHNIHKAEEEEEEKLPLSLSECRAVIHGLKSANQKQSQEVFY